jgi:hypothetical protein
MTRIQRSRDTVRNAAALASALFLVPCLANGLRAQTPVESEVRQIVTFTFLPGKSDEALDLYRERAIPLYRDNAALLSVRGFREVESPVPLDLMVVSAFRGMAGMDQANAATRALATEKGTSIGALYGAISALSAGHSDQFVQMLPSLGGGDSSSDRLTAMVWYQVVPGRSAEFEEVLGDAVAPWERASGIPSATGRFLISDGWHYLRMLAFDSLGAYQEYWMRLESEVGITPLDRLTVRRREVLVASARDLAVR